MRPGRSGEVDGPPTLKRWPLALQVVLILLGIAVIGATFWDWLSWIRPTRDGAGVRLSVLVVGALALSFLGRQLVDKDKTTDPLVLRFVRVVLILGIGVFLLLFWAFIAPSL